MDLGSSSDSSTAGVVIISGEGGVAVFDSGPEGDFPNTEFRVDEAKLFVDASIWNDVYFFTELDLTTREDEDYLELGELYVDFEDVSKLWGKEQQLNVRMGRVDIPFGEEYLVRDAIDNPLISHSVMDLWGVDEGIEVYGTLKPTRYAFAVLNGGISKFRDFNSDKSVAFRFSVDPHPKIHLSVSAFRTGNLDRKQDVLSALWFGNGFFRSLGSSSTTKFHSNLVEGDAKFSWDKGHVAGFVGAAHYDDDDPEGDNHRDLTYYEFESIQSLWSRAEKNLYAGLRFSRINTDHGFPIVGHGDFGEYFFNPANFSENLWRLTLGTGIHLGTSLLIKAEYSWEGGDVIDGSKRDEENFTAAEVAFKF